MKPRFHSNQRLPKIHGVRDSRRMSTAYHLSEWEEKRDGQYVPKLLSPLQIRDNSTFLDVGCGSGYVNAYVARCCTCRLNLGLDLELETLSMARQLNGNSNSIFWVCASAEVIPLPDHSVDHIVCRGVLPLAVVNQVLAEMGRILRPGGTAVFLLHSWTFYLRWLSLNPRNWKRSVAGLLHFLLGLWFNLTGRQIQFRAGQHRIGQTFQTEFLMGRLLRKQRLVLKKVVRKPEFLAYAAKPAESSLPGTKSV